MATARVNGAEIYYEDAGSGPPIILSPGGLQGIAISYQPVIGTLSEEHRVVVYDRRFGGQSRSPLVVQTWDTVWLPSLSQSQMLLAPARSEAKAILEPSGESSAPQSAREAEVNLVRPPCPSEIGPSMRQRSLLK